MADGYNRRVEELVLRSLPGTKEYLAGELKKYRRTVLRLGGDDHAHLDVENAIDRLKRRKSVVFIGGMWRKSCPPC